MFLANDQTQTSASSDLSASTPVLEVETQTAPETNTNTTLTPPTHNLNLRHYKECTVKRGLSPEWTAVNVRSMNTKEATERLGYKAKSEGMWLEGFNGFGQYRPDKPWKAENDIGKKAPKYRTATKEEYDAMLPKHPSNKQYWTDYVALRELAWKINGHPCLLITEGLFKAIMACFHDMPCVALAGVEQGLTSGKLDPQGKRYLVETLERLARANFGFIIIFDADSATNSNINIAQYKLAQQLEKFKVPVYISSGWDMELGKGMDDYIQNNGIEQFKREVMGKLVDFASWEKQFTDNQSPKRLSQRNFVNQFTEKYRPKMAWNVAAKAWYWYETKDRAGVWGEIPAEEAMDIITCELDARNCDYSCGYVQGVLTLLKAKLRINEWEVCKGLVCLEDCVINIHTLEVTEHQPGYRFLSRLPFKWADREVGCAPIQEWLLATCGNRPDWVEVLRAAINATLTERGAELQRYIELIGAGGTGKGTVLRLVQALLGKENFAVTNLKQLEGNRFESAMFYGKKAIFITDSERYTGDVSTLKALTGEDDLRFEKKNVQQTGSFVFPGVVWVAANEAIQSTDYTNALARRRLSMSFECFTPPNLREDLMLKFKPYLPGLLYWVLSMNACEVADYFRNTNKRVPSLAAFSIEVLLETNPLANWANQCLYFDPNISTQIGDARNSPENCLYPNYAQWAPANRQGEMSTQRFSSNLLNLLRTQLGIDAKKIRTKTGRFITGIGIRLSGNNLPSLFGDDPASPDGASMTDKVPTQSPAGADTQGNADPNTKNNSNCNSPATSNSPSPPPLEQHQHQKENKKENKTQHNQQNGSTSAPPSLSGQHQEKGAPTPANQQASTKVPNNAASGNSKNAQIPTGADVESLLNLPEQVTKLWSDKSALGQLILDFAGTLELQAVIKDLTPEQIKHIKGAAKSAWRPNPASPAEYRGEKCELMKYGNDKKWQVRLVSGTEVINVSGNEVYPWLGF
jgi:putative DNA primase/helicase